MTLDELFRIVQIRGYEAKTKTDEVIIRNCIFCGNPNWNLELNPKKGVFSCWACKESGALQDLLQEHFGKDVRISVSLDNKDDKNYTSSQKVTLGEGFVSAKNIPSAYKWLKKRGLSAADIRRYQLKVCTKEDHEHYGRIVFPLYNYWTSQLCGFISRLYAKQEGPKYLTNIEIKAPYGYRTTVKPSLHVLVEGTFDGIAVHKTGHNAHVLLGTGSNERTIEWASTLPKDHTVLLLLDGDKPGQERSEALKNIIAMVREEPTIVNLPEDVDPADLKKPVLKKLIGNAYANT